MPPPTPTTFGPLDWLILAGYFALLLLTGYIFSRREAKTSREYFLAGRQMPVWAVAVSVLATSLSAATFIGAPAQSFDGDLTYLSANIGAIIAVFIVAVLFIPVFYRMDVSTVYQLLDRRFGVPAKRGASAMFMLGRIFASGARVYMVAIPASLIVFGDDKNPAHLMLAIAVLSTAAILYTLAGGIRSIIWTDCIQAAVFVSAALAAIGLLLHKIPLSTPDLFHELSRSTTPDGTPKLSIIPLGMDPSRKYTLLTALTGFVLLNIGAYGTDHDLTQRMLTCKSSIRGSWSAIAGVLVGMPVAALFMLIGLLLYIFDSRPDLMGAVAPGYQPTSSASVFLAFMLHEMPPGMSGVMMAGFFAAGLGSLNSAINAMSATFLNDFYRPMRPGKSEEHYLRAGRLGVVGWGVVLGGFACICVYWYESSSKTGTTLIDFALGVMTFAYAGLVAVFLCAILTRRGNSLTACLALAAGFLIVLALQPDIYAQWAKNIAWTSIVEDADAGSVTTAAHSLADFKIAYPWHLTLGATVAFIVCCLGTPHSDIKLPPQ